MRQLLVVPILMLFAVPVAAQVSVNVDTDTHDGQSTTHSSYDHADKKMEPLRVSELLGHAITNGSDETLGSIEDIVLDRKDGSVKYVAVSMGGFLGMGDKLFAVPYDKLGCEQREDEYVITLDVPKEQLKNAEGFDQDDWPNMADDQWRSQNDRVYKSSSRQGSSNRSNR